MTQMQPYTRAGGVTPAERYLHALAEGSFLSLWSHVGIFRDQGGGGGKGDGKEVCDLLVVFENHVLIFSDKDCAFPDTDDLDRDWSRWYRRAVEASARQVWGAERWLREHPDRLFLDRACTRPFPVAVPSPGVARVHRIVVAHGVSERCRRELGGSGSLMIAPGIAGQEHCAPRAQGGMPFAVGRVDPARGYIHVLDDTSLDVVMRTLDTITDFVAYLSKKEELLLGGRLGWAAGEEDLLAYYLRHLNEAGEHDFEVPPGINAIFVDEGLWLDFKHHPQRFAQLQANEVSYAWDRLIEAFSGHALDGTQHFTTHPGISEQERLIRFLAREPRTRRRMLARLLLDLINETPVGQLRAARVVQPSRPDDPHYVFLLLAEPVDRPYEEYRQVRRTLLEAYCAAVKLRRDAAAMDIVGIATETGTSAERSEDLVYLDTRNWSEQERLEYQRFADDLGLLRDVREFASVEREYPDLASEQ